MNTCCFVMRWHKKQAFLDLFWTCSIQHSYWRLRTIPIVPFYFLNFLTMENETIDIYSVSLVIADIPDMTDTSSKWIRNYKEYIYSLLCSVYRLLQSGWNVLFFFNLDYMPWIGKELRKFNILTYNWPISFDTEGDDTIKSRYHICYRLQEWNLSFVPQRPKKHKIESSETTKESFIENLIIKFTKPWEVVLNCFETHKEMSAICTRNDRKCRTLPIRNDKGE